ncbi:MAG: DKNYY domain-containing protein [Minisyncoccia bacterium]
MESAGKAGAGIIALVLVVGAVAWWYRNMPRDMHTTKPITAVEAVSTSTDVVEPEGHSVSWALYSYHNFLIPYPKTWDTGEPEKDCSSGSFTANPRYPVESPVGFSAFAYNPNEYIGGPDEIVEDERKISGEYDKVGTYTLPQLHTTANEYRIEKQGGYITDDYVFATPQGDLWLSFTYNQASTTASIPGISGTTVDEFVTEILNSLAFATTTQDGSMVLASSTMEKRYLGSHFSRDDSHVYYLGGLVEGADPNTFSVIPDMPVGQEAGKDASAVYAVTEECGGATAYKLSGSDPNTFRPIKDSNGSDTDYAIDSRQVYWWGFTPDASDFGPSAYQPIAGADPNSFVILSGGFSKDAHSVFYNQTKIIGADPTSFVILSSSQDAPIMYAKDSSAVYAVYGYSIKNITGADPNSFQVLDLEYTKDKNAVYYYGNKMAADPATFRVVLTESGPSWGYDKNGWWYSGSLTQARNP